MCVVINQFLSLSNLCDMPRFHCATCSGLPVRLAPFSLCDLLRIMHITGLEFQISVGVDGTADKYLPMLEWAKPVLTGDGFL